ncbi:hypothetical protein Bca52824_015543 [Brassica carinata]|uniref:BURP domain-containing protein n=1 Tax=Brassica carinata TaxID=52824 RepID=A0A8X8B4G1_BRACI|nr:hypothetical protein Bca52824_015543 [Brassica carinata]
MRVVFVGGRLIDGGFSAEENPFTPKASLVRYWNKEITADKSLRSEFLISKASPLNAVDSAIFAKLAAQNSLPTRLPDFCSAANLFCFPDLTPSLEKHNDDVKFSVYDQKNFTSYGNARAAGADSFKTYSKGLNGAIDTFRRYSRNAAGHDDKFTVYGERGNVDEKDFNSYGTSGTGGAGDFTNYQNEANIPVSRFTAYSDGGTGRSQTFKTYTRDANAGNGQSFTSYSKKGNASPNEFASYGDSSNVIGSGFTNYGEEGNGATDTFTSYASGGNVPLNEFKTTASPYGVNGNDAVDTFANYRDKANVGDDSFTSYAKASNSGTVKFINYGQSYNPGSETFTGYGKGSEAHKISFKTYTPNSTFKDYAKNGVAFAKYNVSSIGGGKTVNKWIEPGKFFRESTLKEGTVIPMPDIKDKMPKRSFLPRSIVSKLPFSTSKLAEVKTIFHAGDNSSMEKIISDAVTECERPPSAGETKRCVGSAEDMIDFATSVLGRSVSLYPYLLYYCHSVPKVRVYEADLLELTGKTKINHGIAICHIDTSSWSPTHGAFLALGSKPGQIEVCHWIFENDMN